MIRRPCLTVDEQCFTTVVTESSALLMLAQVGALVSFGGYNGRYHRAVHLFKPGAFVGRSSCRSLSSTRINYERCVSLNSRHSRPVMSNATHSLSMCLTGFMRLILPNVAHCIILPY